MQGEEVPTCTSWCDFCRRKLPMLNPETMEPATFDYEGAYIIVHDDVYHPAEFDGTTRTS